MKQFILFLIGFIFLVIGFYGSHIIQKEIGSDSNFIYQDVECFDSHDNLIEGLTCKEKAYVADGFETSGFLSLFFTLFIVLGFAAIIISFLEKFLFNSGGKEE